MNIHIIAIGKNMPEWVNTGCNEYISRIPADYKINLIEIAAEKRTKNSDINRVLSKEVEKIKSAIPKNSKTIILDRLGKAINTKTIAKYLKNWHDDSQDIAIIIGGPEGLPDYFLNEAQTLWSLSELTLPHPMVRVILTEQIFRAWSIINNHPYHR